MIQDGVGYLLFTLSAESEESFAVEVVRTTQVLEGQWVTPVPLSPPVVEGIINHNGRIVTVVDPASLLGREPQSEPGGQLVVLEKSEPGGGNLALKVSAVREIVSGESLKPVEIEMGPSVAWVGSYGRGLVHVIGFESFMERLSREFGLRHPTARSARSEGARA